jgi:hypothetical protein
MVSSLLLLLWASRSFAMPVSTTDVPYLIDGLNQHEAPEKLNFPSEISWISDFFPNSGEQNRRQYVNVHPWVKTEAPINLRAADNDTQDQQASAGDQFTALADIINFRRTCETDPWRTILTMDEMYMNVGAVVEDLEGHIRIKSYEWGEDVPGNPYRTTWIYVDILDDGPLVTATLIGGMLKLMIYDKSCYTEDATRGGRLWAIHEGNEIANVVIYATDSRDT